MFLERGLGAVGEGFAAGDLEPHVGHRRREGEPPAEVVEGDEQELAAGGTAAQLDFQGEAVGRERRRERPAGGDVLPVGAGVELDGADDVAGELGEEAVEVGVGAGGAREEQRPGREPGLRLGDVDGDAEPHGEP